MLKVKKIMDKVIRNMPKKYARVLISFYMEFMTLGEIAKIEKITYGRVRTRFNNALGEAGKLLEEYGYSQDRILEMVNQEKWMKNIYVEKMAKSKQENKTIKKSCGFVDYAMEMNQKSNSSLVAFLTV